jgi:multiple sugar transport system ATP-binding protein
MAQVTVSGLVKRFGAMTPAVDHIDMTIEDGEFVFLLGPSGCGKTTTLRMIAGLEMPTEGRIEIGGRNVTYLRPRYRNVGMVFQDYGLYRHMTVYENIAYPLRVRKMSREAIATKVGAVAETLKITDVLSRRPDGLSGGQLQRVAIARMLVRDANVFLMDEPMSHLDAQLRAHMRAELKHIQKSIGTTTIFVTHDQLEAMTMADRIIVMRRGVINQYATPQEIFELPANLFVATFVGEPQMNILDCRIDRRDGSFVASGPGYAVELDRDWLEASGALSRAGRPMRLGIRPEHVGISDDPRDGYPIEAKIFAFEATGAENLFTVTVGGELVTVKAPTSETLHYDTSDGSSVFLRFDPGRIYLFDAETEVTLAQAAACQRVSA